MPPVAFAEGIAGLVQGVFGSHLEGLAVLGVEVAQDVERGNVGKGVDESRAETRHDIEVRAAGLEEGEEAAAVHTLAAGENLVGVFQAVDDEVEGLQPPVVRHVAEVDHLYVELLDDLEDIGLGEFTHRFLKELHQTVGVKFQFFLCHMKYFFEIGTAKIRIFFVSLQSQTKNYLLCSKKRPILQDVSNCAKT